MSIVIAVDAMGGDHGLSTTIPSTIRFIKQFPNVTILLVGKLDLMEKSLSKYNGYNKEQIELVNATQVVEMDELPQSAMRQKKDSSMRVAINLVKDKRASGIVSAGNTGALMAIARFVLRTMSGIDRPAIAKLLPTLGSDVCVLDLGANVECEPEHLLQFAIMGSLLMQGIFNKESPKVGVLNIGSEDIKGHAGIKKAAELIRNSKLNFCGNVEGDDIFKGTVDVVVTDGFTGNVALKVTEGVAKMMGHHVKTEFSRNIFTKLAALSVMFILNRVKKRLDTNKYNGAILLGLNGLVIKSHGGASADGFYYALLQAMHGIEGNVIPKMTEYLDRHLQELLESQAEEYVEFKELNML